MGGLCRSMAGCLGFQRPGSARVFNFLPAGGESRREVVTLEKVRQALRRAT